MARERRRKNGPSAEPAQATTEGSGHAPVPLRNMGIEEFVRRIKSDINGSSGVDKRFALFLGAGCSVSSGIPAAGALVRERWIPKLLDYRPPPPMTELDAWVAQQIPGYEPANPARSYGELIDALFTTPYDRQREIEILCDGRTPSFGYAVLAQLVAQEAGRFNLVLTTNFDDLLADALYLYTPVRPLVIHHESLASFIRPTRTRPLIVKLHGDHRLAPRNTSLETATLQRAMRQYTTMALHDRGIIFMGYSGGDRGILDMLEELPDEALPFGAFWVHPEEPQGAIRAWLLRRGGVWVRSGWFDDVMLTMRNAFALQHPLADRFERIFRDYHETFNQLSRRIVQKPATDAEAKALQLAVTETEASLPGFWRPLSEALRLESTEPVKADEIYRTAIGEFPDAAPLLGAYANFLSDNRDDFDAAEAMYERAIRADPKDADVLGNYAIFLEQQRKDIPAAERRFKQAIEANPRHANNLSSYATLLNDRREFAAAEALYRRALDADPEHEGCLCNYARCLWEQGKDLDLAESMYRKAIEINPKNGTSIGNYAVFLDEHRNDMDATEAMYKRALELDPRDQQVLSNYAMFLSLRRADSDAAEKMYERAMRQGSPSVDTLRNYADFLWQKSGKLGEAEAIYAKAIEIDPDDASILVNCAQLMLARGNRQGLPMLQRVLALPDAAVSAAIRLECLFSLFAHGQATEREGVLRGIRQSVLDGVRSPGWNFAPIIDRATADGHPEDDWLVRLAAVINGIEEPAVLADWPAWQAGARE